MPTLYERRVRRQINRLRDEHDLTPVRFDDRANAVARRWALHLQATGEFVHQSMAVVLDDCGATYAGEILGRGDVGPAGFADLWLHSPAHRQVMLNGVYRRVGISALRIPYGRVVVVDFICR